MQPGGKVMTTPPRTVPPLESGDRLTREEFHRRYCEWPDIRKAELINGVVYVASPVRYELHDEPHTIVVMWLGVYAAMTPGVRAGGEATILLGDRSEVQPDGFLFRVGPPGNARITDRDYIEGAPELIVEVAASSASRDLHDKLEAYREAGVLEYIVWLVIEKELRWLRLRDSAYVLVEPDERGVIESAGFPGLRLNVPALLAGDRAGVLAALTAAPPPTE
jgi:Uma2 family endonuclease